MSLGALHFLLLLYLCLIFGALNTFMQRVTDLSNRQIIVGQKPAVYYSRGTGI